MTGLASFLTDLFSEGRILVRDRLGDEAAPDALNVLRRAYQAHALAVAGPAVPLDGAAAVAAARLLHDAARCFLDPLQSLADAGLTLEMPLRPTTPAHHLSADLVLRFVPTLHRRVRALRPNDELAGRLATLLRTWPLSGVLGDVADEPLTPPAFGHAGLELLYAERLARHEKPAWVPTGPARQAVELVWEQLGRDVALLPKEHDA